MHLAQGNETGCGDPFGSARSLSRSRQNFTEVGQGMSIWKVIGIVVMLFVGFSIGSFALTGKVDQASLAPPPSPNELAEHAALMAEAAPEAEARFAVFMQIEDMGGVAIELPNGTYKAAVVWPDGSHVIGEVTVQDGNVRCVIPKPVGGNLETRRE